MDENEYELERQRNIRRNQELLKNLELGLSTKSPRSTPKESKQSSTKKKQKPTKVDHQTSRPLRPLRSSSRLRGIEADPGPVKRKAEDELEAQIQASKAKKKRVEGELLLKDIIQVGKDGRGLDEQWKDAEQVLGQIKTTRKGHISHSKLHDSTYGDLAKLRKAMGRLRLFDKWAPNEIKITPERIYSMQLFPSNDRRMVLAGDKAGYLGIWDVDGSRSDPDNAIELPLIHQFKLHGSTISSLIHDPNSIQKLYSASYDSTIRSLDLVSGISTEVYVPEIEDGNSTGPLVSGVELYPDGNVLIFSDTSGSVGRCDLRQRSSLTDLYDLHEVKIGCISLHPLAPHLLLTSSLDRTMKLWDLRNISGSKASKLPFLVGEYTSRLSVSCAYWNKNAIVSTSYDDTIRVFTFQTVTQWPLKYSLGTMEPGYTIKHDNQTGRWVTILRARWHQNPESGVQKFVIGNMKRAIDVYSDTGVLLAQLSDPEKITAVPAVCQFHPTQEWLAGGTASGKICAFFPENN